MNTFLSPLHTVLDTTRFTARWLCGEWTPALGWLHIGSDLAIWSAYFSIPALLLLLTRRRRDLPFRRVFLLFGAFILLCGTTHLVEAVIFWWPIYPVAGAIKLATAVASWGTVIALAPVVRDALRLRSPAQLEAEVAQRTGQLQQLNAALAVEVDRHRQTLASLHEAEVRLRGALQSATLLAEAGHALAGLVDVESTLGRVASLAVPRFADFCAVSLLQPDGTLRRVALENGADGRLRALTDTLATRYPETSGASALRVVRSGTAELVPEISADSVRAAVQDPELAASLIGLGLRSYITVPLTARGRVLGALTFVTAASGRIYTADDLAVAEDLGARAAVAVDNAQLYEALREADRRKDQFLALLAHELRNPLAPLATVAQILERSEADAQDRARLAAILGRQVRHLTRLIDDLLDVARITEGKIALRREAVTVGELVDRAVEMVDTQAAAAGARIDRAVDVAATIITVDPSRTVQALANLVGNAVKFSPRGGTVRVAAHLDGQDAVFTVSDDGEGFPPAHAERLFDMFAQGAGQEGKGGLGLGLYLVRAVAVLHRGTATAHSDGPGRGSRFTLRLPAAPEPHTDIPAAPRTALRPGGRRVLVADDNRDAADSLAMLLSLAGHDVRVAHGGTAALSVARVFRPEVALVDIGMPLLDGYEVARRLAAGPGRPALLAAISGWGDAEARQRTQAAGFDAHLVKPVQWDALAALLAR
jgi:signal transduction histidine kinase